MSVDEELRVEDVRRDGGDAHVHRHLEVRIDAGRPFLVAHRESSKLRFHANVLGAPDEDLGVRDIQAHFEVRTHDGLGDFQLQRGRTCHRVGINIRIVRSCDDAVRARRRSDDEVVEVEANPLARAERLHALIGFAHFFERRSTGFNEGHNAGLIHGAVKFRVEKESVQVDLDLEGAKKFLKLADAIEELDDVQNVYSNANVSADVIEQLEAE